MDLSNASSGIDTLKTFFISNFLFCDLARAIFKKSFPNSSKIILLLIFLKTPEKIALRSSILYSLIFFLGV